MIGMMNNNDDSDNDHLAPDVLGHEAGDEDTQQPEHPSHHEHPGVAHEVKQGRNLMGSESLKCPHDLCLPVTRS